MEQSEVIESLRGYIGMEILDGRDAGLDETTPLLEWGILNSLEVARLFEFVQSRFGVEIPEEKLVASNLKNLMTIADLIVAAGATAA